MEMQGTEIQTSGPNFTVFLLGTDMILSLSPVMIRTPFTTNPIPHPWNSLKYKKEQKWNKLL